MAYYLIKYLLTPFVYFFLMPKIIGRKNIKIKGKGIVISNHKSMGDPLIISAMFHRQIIWMGKQELFKNKILGALFTAIRTFPVRRGKGDLAAIRHAFKVLRAGEVLGIFPEGTRIRNEDVRGFELGTALLALRSDTPITPIYIKGNYKLFRRMTMVIGEPILLSNVFGKQTNTQTVIKATQYLQDCLLQLKESIQ